MNEGGHLVSTARRRKRAVGSRKPVTGPGWYRAASNAMFLFIEIFCNGIVK
jgi:hypothetical protein